ncbi:MAG: lipopolysaccharide biosynthesis protein [Flavobacteriaceae bacterium]|nr:lipopolysaccharide biosynthesis protein [Flavobacteriaceae bacterium]
MSLAQKGLSGFLYTFGSSLISKGLGLAGGIYLARLLSPEDYGLVAMLFIFFSISNFLVTGGFGLALIREKEITEEDKSTVFFFNLIVSLVLYACIWIASPYIAKFYDEPILEILAKIMGLDMIFKSLTIVQQSTLKRDLKFKELGIVSVFNGIIVISVAVVLAYYGFGVYALVVKFVLGSLGASILLYLINPWKPTSFIKKNSFKKLFAFGSNVMILGLVNSVTREFHKAVIGRYYSTASLGFFNQGSMLKDNLSNTFTETISKVTFPMLSKLQDDKERLKRGYIRILQINSYVIFPLISMLILVAEPLILGLLGEKWSGSIPFLQILCISAYVHHLHKINLNVLKVYGKGKDYIMQGVIRNMLTITGVIIGAYISIYAIAWSLVITEFLQIFVNIHYSNKYIKFRFKEQFKVMLPLIALSLGMSFTVYGIGFFDYSTEILKLIIMLATGCLSYVVLSLVFKVNAFNELIMLLNKKTKH